MNLSQSFRLPDSIRLFAGLVALILLNGCGHAPAPSDETVRKAVEHDLVPRATETYRSAAETIYVDAIHRTNGESHAEKDGEHFRTRGTANLYARLPATISNGDAASQNFELKNGDAVAYAFTIDFRLTDHAWAVESIECQPQRKILAKEHEKEVVNSILATVKDSKLTWAGDRERPLFQNQLRYDQGEIRNAPEGLRRALGKAIVDYVSQLDGSPGFQKDCLLLLKEWLPASAGLPSGASAEEQEKVVREYARAHSDTSVGKALAAVLDQQRAEREKQAAERRSSQSVLSEARLLSGTLKDYIQGKKLGPDVPVSWKTLCDSQDRSDLENKVPQGKDGFGRPYQIGPTAADGVRINSDTFAALAGQIPGGENFWGVYGPEWGRAPASVLKGAQNIATAITAVAKEKMLSDDDPITWATVREAVFKVDPETPSIRFQGKDGFGRAYEIGPTVADGVHLAAETYKAVTAEVGNDLMYYEQFNPANSIHPPGGVVEPNSRTFDHARLRMQPTLLDSDTYVDLWCKIYDADRYKREFGNEFSWGAVRQKVREKLRAAQPTYLTSFRLRLTAHLDKYDMVAGVFRVRGLEKLGSVGVSMNRAFNPMYTEATVYESFPAYVNFTFSPPLNFVTVPCSPDKAQAMVERMLAHGNSNREIECEVQVTAIGVATKSASPSLSVDFPVRVRLVAFTDSTQARSNDEGGPSKAFYRSEVSQDDRSAPPTVPSPTVADEFRPQMPTAEATPAAESVDAGSGAPPTPVQRERTLPRNASSSAPASDPPVLVSQSAAMLAIADQSTRRPPGQPPTFPTPKDSANAGPASTTTPSSALKTEAAAADRELNAAYTPLLARLRKAGPDIANQFVATQKGWLAARDRISDPAQQLAFVRARTNQLRQLTSSFDQKMKAYDNAHQGR